MTNTNTNTQVQTFEPATLEQAMRLSETLAKASIVPVSLRGKPSDILIVLMTGRELGIAPMQSLRQIQVIDGKPVMSADLIVGLCLRQTDICEYFRLVQSDKLAATYETKRRGSEPVKLTWTMEMAKAAGLTGKRNWVTYPDAMLRSRCSAALGRVVYPDLVGGIYEPDEGDSIAAGRVVPAAQAEPRQAEVVVQAKPKSMSDLVQKLGDPAPGKPQDEPVAKAEPEAKPVANVQPVASQEAPVASPLDALSDAVDWYTPGPPNAIDPDAYGQLAEGRYRLSLAPAKPFSTWRDEHVWLKGMLKEWTPWEVIQGSRNGKRHKALIDATEWAVNKANEKGIDWLAKNYSAALKAAYCLALMEERFERAAGQPDEVTGVIDTRDEEFASDEETKA